MTHIVKLTTVLGFLMLFNFSKAQTIVPPIDPPINSGEILKEAEKLNQDKKYDEAIVQYLKIDENDTNYLSACLDLANVYLNASKDDEAVALCDRMLQEKNIYEQSFYIIKGSALDDTGKFDLAVKTYNEGLTKYPKNHFLYYNLGWAYLRKKDYTKAELNFKKALTINPYHAASHMRLGQTAFNEGKLVPAILSYMFFLQLENTTQRAANVVVRLEKILKGEVQPDGPLATAGETDDFSELEAIIKSKVALNGKYKSKIDLQYDMVKQLQLLFEKLTYNSGDKGYWMQTYVPFFTALQKAGYFEDLMYYSLLPIENEGVNKWIKSHESQEKKFIEWASKTLEGTLIYFEEDMNGTKQKVVHSFYSGYKIEAMGNMKNKKNVGYWKYFFTTGSVKSEGTFDQNGERDGLWKYYYNDGGIKEEATFKAGKLVGPYTKYHKNGSKEIVANYQNDLYEGKVETYYVTNMKRASYDFKKGKKEGKEVTYYSNGAKKYELGIVNENPSGSFTQYYANGKVYETCAFTNGKRTGPFVLYYHDGTKKSEGSYKDDNYFGAYKGYYNNGKLQEEGTYNDKGLLVGVFKKYDIEGYLNEEVTYSERGKIISHKYYTPKGKLENELIFKSEELVQSKSYNESGATINDQKKKGKNFVVTFYRVNGNKLSEGGYVEGEREGEWKFYNEDGYLMEIETYKEGKLEGKNTNYHNNGKIKSECDYKAGLIEGLYRSYYINGTVNRQGYYSTNLEQGYWYYYNQNGSLSEIRYYLNGEETGKSQTFAGNGKKYKDDYNKDGYLTRLVYYDTTGTKILNKTDFPFGSSDFIFSYPNGKPRLKGQYKSGLSEGVFTWSYVNGNPETTVTYSNDKKEGPKIYYYENGQKSREETYFNGDLNGVVTSYYENGNVHEQLNYVFGDQNGSQKTFYENKTLYRFANYVYGKAEGGLSYYSEDGQLVIRKYYENDIMKSYSFINKSGKYDSIPVKNETGKIVSYYANGQKSIEFEIEFGYYKGKRFEYFPTGKVKKEENFYYGVLDGLQKNYYANGNLKSQENYLVDEKHGNAKYYYENGKLKQEGNYLNGNKFGDWKYYDVNGKLTKKVRYYDDLVIP